MLKPKSLLLLGLWLIVISFLGVPRDWKTWAYILTGVFMIVLYIGHLGRQSIYRMIGTRAKTDTFTESGFIKDEKLKGGSELPKNPVN